MADIRTVMLGPQQTFLKHAPDHRLIDDIYNPDGGFPKPNGGLWTSTEATNEDEGYLYFCRVEGTDWLRDTTPYTLVPVEPVVEIDTREDLMAVIDRYPREVRYALDYDERYHIDFEALARDYAGLRLTMEGQCATRFGTPNLYGWDFESTIWFRWAFAS